MELPYGLIVSDFDGTLRRTSGGISDENLSVIKKYIQEGGVFALCTGRMPISILPYARQLGLKGLIASYQGALITDIESGRTVRDGRIPVSDAVQICMFLQKSGLHIHVYDGNDLYINKDDMFRNWYEKACNVRGILTPFSISDVVREKKISPHKIVVVCESEARNEILESVAKSFGNRFYITTSTENLVEIVMQGCDKGGALRYLAEYYKIPIEKTIAIGDNFNDLPMLKAAGLGIAVANGEEALKRQAGFVTKSCDHDGVAYVIRKFGFGEKI